jgi:Spy/CpxP family protein refolding chaperone
MVERTSRSLAALAAAAMLTAMIGSAGHSVAPERPAEARADGMAIRHVLAIKNLDETNSQIAKMKAHGIGIERPKPSP